MEIIGISLKKNSLCLQQLEPEKTSNNDKEKVLWSIFNLRPKYIIKKIRKVHCQV